MPQPYDGYLVPNEGKKRTTNGKRVIAKLEDMRLSFDCDVVS